MKILRWILSIFVICKWTTWSLHSHVINAKRCVYHATCSCTLTSIAIEIRDSAASSIETWDNKHPPTLQLPLGGSTKPLDPSTYYIGGEVCFSYGSAGLALFIRYENTKSSLAIQDITQHKLSQWSPLLFTTCAEDTMSGRRCSYNLTIPELHSPYSTKTSNASISEELEWWRNTLPYNYLLWNEISICIYIIYIVIWIFPLYRTLQQSSLWT